jgi:glycosyltransferase involved in cell wall biosynthesis
MFRVLSIVWYKVLPPLFGGQKGIAGFNEELARTVQLTCLCASSNEPSPELNYKIINQLPTHKRQFLSPEVWKQIESTAVKEKSTHLLLEHPYHGIAGVKARKKTGAKLIVHSHNIESQRFKNTGRWWWKLLQQYEGWTHRQADLSLFKTEADRSFAIKKYRLEGSRTMIIPYGIKKNNTKRAIASQVIRKRHNINDSDKLLLFAGTMDYAPNMQAVNDIYTKLIPRLEKMDYRVLLCGRGLDKAVGSKKNKSIILAGEVKDIENYFAAADVFINPVRTGGGIQTKNLEALASDLNVVGFDQMTDSAIKEITPAKVFTCEDGNWDHFCDNIKKALSQQWPTPSLFFERYGWASIVQSFIHRLGSL